MRHCICLTTQCAATRVSRASGSLGVEHHVSCSVKEVQLLQGARISEPWKGGGTGCYFGCGTRGLTVPVVWGSGSLWGGHHFISTLVGGCTSDCDGKMKQLQGIGYSSSSPWKWCVRVGVVRQWLHLGVDGGMQCILILRQDTPYQQLLLRDGTEQQQHGPQACEAQAQLLLWE